jgi:hypothetical protein
MSNKTTICTACGHIGQPQTVTKGHILLEVALWLMMLVPGIIYSIWRLTSRHQACEMCGGTGLIPFNSPVGQQLIAARGLPPVQEPETTKAHEAGKALGAAFHQSTTKKTPQNRVVPWGEFK